MRQPSGSHMMLLEHPARGSDSPRGSPRIGRSITDDVNVEGEEAFPPPKRERSRLRQLACVGVPAILGLVLLWITFRRTVCNGKCTPLWADFFCHDRIIARFAGTHFPGRQAALEAQLGQTPSDVAAGARAWMNACPLHASWMLMPVERPSFLRRSYLQSNWHPGLPGGSACGELTRIGPPGDGGKNLCAPQRMLSASADCAVLSVGSNGDAAFEEAIHQLSPRCRIDTFDGTLNEAKVAMLPAFVTFHPRNFGPDTWRELAQAGVRRLAVLKMDCEGCEYEALPAFIERSPICVEQIVVEIHTCLGGVEALVATHSMLTRLSANYTVFAYEGNLEFSDGTCAELSLQRRTPCAPAGAAAEALGAAKEHHHKTRGSARKA